MFNNWPIERSIMKQRDREREKERFREGLVASARKYTSEQNAHSVKLKSRHTHIVRVGTTWEAYKSPARRFSSNARKRSEWKSVSCLPNYWPKTNCLIKCLVANTIIIVVVVVQVLIELFKLCLDFSDCERGAKKI